MEQTHIIPVMVINDLDGVEELAHCLAEQGLNVLEITLRTDVALSAVEKIKTKYPDLVVGTGTNITTSDLEHSREVGADFMVSPGATVELLDYAKQKELPLLPGVATASEVMQAMAIGFTELKLFPAQAVGGIALLKSWAGPLPQASFCPTGGINADNANDYLSLKNVLCVGGSWMLDKQLIANKDWSALEKILIKMNSKLNLI
jgi:2-dehydro-3-deoxyphosphogluconate aldolase/(4S)-4-hydroxy-2-oxoglutarate aldolase